MTKTSTPLIYVAGPFGAPTAWGVAENVRAAERLGLELARAGIMPLIPHTNCVHFRGECTGEFWLEGTLEMMRRCDAVLLCPGWEQSPGTLGEIAEANRLGIPVFKGLDEVTVWNGTRFRDQAPAPEAPEPTRPSAAGMAIINAARKVAILVTPSLLVFPKDFWTENGFIFLDEQVAGDCVYCIHFMLCMECKNACTSFPEWEFVQKLADLLGYMHIAVSWHEDRLWIEASGSHA